MANKCIVMVHGRHVKPEQKVLQAYWHQCIEAGLRRDFGTGGVTAFRRAVKEFVYYGDISNAFLVAKAGECVPDAAAYRKSHDVTFANLQALKPADFNKKRYDKLPGKDSFKEFIADVLGDALAWVRMSDPLIGAVAPDLREYWNEDTEFGSDVRFRMIAPLKRALDAGPTLVLAHSMGTMVAYDTFWKFSHTGEYRPVYSNNEIELFITLGSPLSDETVKRSLKGSGIDGPRRFPQTIKRWVNVAAEDDFVSHDGRLADDFKPMSKPPINTIMSDEFIYNMAVRDGKSNPHHEGGYLIHPTVTRLIHDWLAN